MPRGKGLTDKQAAFAREYVIDFNASAAALRAGYSQRTAGRTAAELMKDARVQAEIQRLTAAKAARASMEADEVVEQLVNIVRSDISDVMTWGMAEVEDEEGLPLPSPIWSASLRRVWG